MDFLRQIRVAVLTDRHVLNIRDLRSHCIQACLHGERRKSSEMFTAVQPFLGDSELHFTIDDDGRRGIGVKHV